MVMFVVLLAGTAAISPAVTVRDIVETRDITGVSISPDEEWVAYRVSQPSADLNRVDLGWYVVPAHGGAARRVADGGDARFDFAGVIEEDLPVWDADSRGFHFLARQGGATAIWSWRDGGAATLAVGDPADIIDFRPSADGRALIYRTGTPRAAVAAAERQAYDGGVLVDATVDLMQPVAGGAILDGERVMQRLPGPWFERSRLLSDRAIDEKQLALQRPSASGAPAEPAQNAQRKAINSAGVSAEIVTEKGKVSVRFESPGGKTSHCRRGACASPRLRALVSRPGTAELLLFESADGSAERIWTMKPGDAGPSLLAQTDGAISSARRPPRCAVAQTFLACSDASATEPPRLVRLAYGSGKATALADPNATLRSRIRTRALPMTWHDPGGTLFSGILLRPSGARTASPLVIQYYHCDGFLKGGVGDEIPMIPLTEAGIAVLCIRKAPAPDGPTDREYDLALSGIGAAIDRLAADGAIDPRRVGIGGLSFGSQVTLWAVRHSDRFAAATLSSGQFEPLFYWAYALPGSGIPKMLEDYWALGDPDTDARGWQRLSAVSHVDRIDTPLLMQLPESEARLVTEFHTRLKRAGKPAELFVFADEPHIKMQPVHQFSANERNLDWYKFWLLGLEDDGSPKAAQFARWRAYRAGQSLPAPAP